VLLHFARSLPHTRGFFFTFTLPIEIIYFSSGVLKVVFKKKGEINSYNISNTIKRGGL